jgi:hypothetical protein
VENVWVAGARADGSNRNSGKSVPSLFLALAMQAVNAKNRLFQLDDQTVSNGHATVHAGGDVHVMGGDQHGQS